MPRFQSREGGRLHWRVIVQSSPKRDGSREGTKMVWHLVECADPLLTTAHCVEGRLLMDAGGDPDGHCLIGDACPRCAVLSEAKAAIASVESQAAVSAAEAPQATVPISQDGGGS